MKAVAIHEAVPGYHFQLSLNMERRETPRWRGRVFGGATANIEGWAPYAEKLAIDQGWYEGDLVQLLGAGFVPLIGMSDVVRAWAAAA